MYSSFLRAKRILYFFAYYQAIIEETSTKEKCSTIKKYFLININYMVDTCGITIKRDYSIDKPFAV